MKVSVCVPTYEMTGKGVYFLDKLLSSILCQDYEDYEVIISDNSDNKDLLRLVLKYKDDRIKHSFYARKKFYEKKESSTNINNSIRLATGDIIKPMFQDDYLNTTNCLSELVKYYDGNNWFMYTRIQVGENFRSKKIYPYFHKYTILGVNRISSPSAIAFPANSGLFFDENLNWLMDCEFYQRLYLKYGEPLLLENACVAIREWGKQVSKTLDSKDKETDLDYVKAKYGIIDDIKAW